MSDTKRDPTRTEDVGGWDLGERFQSIGDACRELEMRGEKEHAQWIHDDLLVLRAAFRDLRERLEEAEEERERLKRKVNKWIFRRSAARRRADRLEEAAEFALSTIKSLDPHGKKDGQTPQAKELLIRALDSREDEGEVYGIPQTEETPEEKRAWGRLFDDNTEPVHADEPEGDEGGYVTCVHCGGPTEGFHRTVWIGSEPHHKSCASAVL